MSYKILSTFTGAGGLDIGFHGDFNFLGKHFDKLPFETIASVEFNKFATETIQYNKKYFPNTKIFHNDISKLDKSKIKGEFDILLGGFPCLAFSMVGKRLGITDNKSGQLYESFAQYIEYFKPKVFVAENVRGILSANKGEAIKIIKERFEKTGYNLSIHSVNFADYGVPQLRNRVLFIGIRKDIKGVFESPEPTHSKNNYITSGMAFENIPNNAFNNNLLNQRENTINRIASIPEGGNYTDFPPEFKMNCRLSNMYRRLDRNIPSYTVLASGGGGTWHYHYEENRTLTNRERARLQGFPDDLNFQGNDTEIRRQIGNAVPPVGIYPFALNIVKLLDNCF